MKADAVKKNIIEEELGLTKREYFAIQALKGILSGRKGAYEESQISNWTDLAIKQADNLIEVLNKTK